MGGIKNCSLMNIYPLNNVNRKPYNDRDWFIKNGYINFIETKAGDFKKSTILDQPVTKIAYSNQHVKVVTKEGEKKGVVMEIDAEYAICAIPLGVLQKESVEFNPPFSSEKQGAINAYAMGNYEKIYAQFNENFWGDKEVLMFINGDRPPAESIMTWGLNLDI